MGARPKMGHKKFRFSWRSAARMVGFNDNRNPMAEDILAH